MELGRAQHWIWVALRRGLRANGSSESESGCKSVEGIRCPLHGEDKVFSNNVIVMTERTGKRSLVPSTPRRRGNV